MPYHATISTALTFLPAEWRCNADEFMSFMLVNLSELAVA
jgi:hypothetical protein